MKKSSDDRQHGASIALVERDTGLSKDTLRVWERRYGFPAPDRDANGERVYPRDQVEKLRLLRRLMDGGCRPGKIVPMGMDELNALAGQVAARRQVAGVPEAVPDPEIAEFIDLLRRHQTGALAQSMSTAVLKRGLEQFVIDVAAPLCTAVGEAWARGEIRVFEEHIFTEQLTHVMRTALGSVRRSVPDPDSTQDRPRVVLTTFPQEQHALGLLMAEVLLALHGCTCVSLGVQTPVPDIVMAADAQRADIVALSFSMCMSPAQAVDGLLSLRSQLAAEAEIWVGGHCQALGKRGLAGADGIHAIPELTGIAAAVAAWRERHPGKAPGLPVR